MIGGVAAAVLDRVGQHLLQHPVGDDLELGRQRRRVPTSVATTSWPPARTPSTSSSRPPAGRGRRLGAGQHLAHVLQRGARRGRDRGHRLLERAGVGVGEVLRRLGLGQDHRERVPDDVVHVAGQPGLLLAQPGDLLGLLGLALGEGRLAPRPRPGRRGIAGAGHEAQRQAEQPRHGEDHEEQQHEREAPGVAEGVGQLDRPLVVAQDRVDDPGSRRDTRWPPGGPPPRRPGCSGPSPPPSRLAAPARAAERDHRSP